MATETLHPEALKDLIDTLRTWNGGGSNYGNGRPTYSNDAAVCTFEELESPDDTRAVIGHDDQVTFEDDEIVQWLCTRCGAEGDYDPNEVL